MNFNFGATKGASEAPKMLTAGIHTATFKGIKKETITTKAGDDMDVMQVTFNVKDFGEYKQNFFAPNSTERTEGQYGLNPSPMEHFLVIVRQILDALDSKFGKDIDEGNSPIEGTSFTQVVNSLKKLTTPYIDKEVQIKLLPVNGYASMPTFPARIRTTKDGTVLGLGYATTIIAAKDLTLLPKEVKKIETAKNAKPTNMSAPAKNDLLSGMSDLLDEGDKDDDSDLPF